MKIEVYCQDNGEVFLLSPPVCLKSEAFDICLNYLLESQKQEWYGIPGDELFLKSLRGINFEDNSFKCRGNIEGMLSIFLSLFSYRCNGNIDKNTLTVNDLNQLLVLSLRLIEPVTLPSIPSKKDEIDWQSKIQTTGDTISDLTGDLIECFGGGIVNLLNTFDFNSLWQILNRRSQNFYWSNPEIHKEIEDKEERRKAKEQLNRIFKARQEGTLKYVDGKPEPKRETLDLDAIT